MPIDKCLILGVGGVGSWLSEYMIRMSPPGIEFTLCDGDKVEEKNLLYSNFVKEDIDQNKAKVLQKRFLNKLGVDVRALDKFVQTPSEIHEWSIGNLIIICTDDMVSRQMIQREADFYVDVRAEDALYQVYTHKSELAKAMSMTKMPDKHGSCQSDPFKRVYTGHLKGAVKGTELALAILRDEPFPAEDLGVLIRR